jgi:hypothetical protein
LDDADQAKRDDAYRAIGRYGVAFSALIATMRDLIATRLNGAEFRLGQMALGESMPMSIAHAFFGIARDTNDFSDAERDVAGVLELAVTETIKERTHFAHGDWLVDYYNVTGDPMNPLTLATPRRVRILPHQKEGPYKIDDLTPAEIDATTDALLALVTDIYEFGRIAFGAPVIAADPETGAGKMEHVRIGDVYSVEPRPKGSDKRKRVIRDGPRAEDIVRITWTG